VSIAQSNSATAPDARPNPIEVAKNTWEAGQVRMATYLARISGRKLLYVPSVGWYWWDGKRWKPDEIDVTSRHVIKVFKLAINSVRDAQARAEKESDSQAKDKLLKQASKLTSDVRTCQSAAGIAGIKKIAQSDPVFVRESLRLDSDRYLFNLQNGTLNLKTGEFVDHDPEHLITKVASANFIPDIFDDFDPQNCPRWIKFLEEVLPDSETREFLQTLMGVALVGDQIEHVLPVLFGNGRNGKGVFSETMLHVFGDYGLAAARDLFTAAPNAHTTSQTDLMGSRLAVVDETEDGATLSESLVKSSTGGGVHRARKMKQDNVDFKRTWLAIMVTNHFPRVTGKGAAIWDRLHVIEFPVYFDETHRDNTLGEALKKEADGIFMWAYAGLVRYWRTNRLIAPLQVKLETQRQRHKNDRVQQWIDEECEQGTHQTCSSKAKVLHSQFEAWSNANCADRTPAVGTPMGYHDFLELLRNKGFGHDQKRGLIKGLRPGRGKNAS
jgi:putative DNA primase/helicase